MKLKKMNKSILTDRRVILIIIITLLIFSITNLLKASCNTARGIFKLIIDKLETLNSINTLIRS